MLYVSLQIRDNSMSPIISLKLIDGETCQRTDPYAAAAAHEYLR
jgi:hypothetical protein